MDGALTRFVRALRMADVRVSTAETLDAFRVVDLVGWQDRERLRHGLAAVLAKSTDEANAFDACFEQFFRFDDFDAGAQPAPVDDETQAYPTGNETLPTNDQADGSMPGDSQSGGNGVDHRESNDLDAGDHDRASTAAPVPLDPVDISSPSSPLGRQLMADDRTALSIAISSAARQHRIEDIKIFTQQGLYTRRIMDTMGRPALIDEIIGLEAAHRPADQRLGDELRRRHDRLRQQIRDYVEGQFFIHADARGERLRMQMLRTTRIGNIPAHNDHLMRRMIERMARQLIAAHTRKRRITRRGTLDVPRMIRKNMRHDAHLIELAWKSKRIDKPRVFVLCDVSGSVAYYARFMLMFLYSLGEVLPRVRAFAFCSELAEVTDLFRTYDLDEASRRTLAEHGQGGTDYATAFADFERIALDDVDRRSTVLILGDARNNHGDPRTDLLRKIYDRSQRVIWLNPEPRAAWDSGDSEMGRYAAHCHQVNACGSLAQLDRVVSDLLRRVS